MLNKGYVYCIEPAQLVGGKYGACGTHTRVKIGRGENFSRVKSYHKTSIFHLIFYVDCYKDKERKLLDEFSKKFHLVCGYETFEGPLEEMKKCFIDCINDSDNEYTQEEKEVFDNLSRIYDEPKYDCFSNEYTLHDKYFKFIEDNDFSRLYRDTFENRLADKLYTSSCHITNKALKIINSKYTITNNHNDYIRVKHLYKFYKDTYEKFNVDELNFINLIEAILRVKSKHTFAPIIMEYSSYAMQSRYFLNTNLYTYGDGTDDDYIISGIKRKSIIIEPPTVTQPLINEVVGKFYDENGCSINKNGIYKPIKLNDYRDTISFHCKNDNIQNICNHLCKKYVLRDAIVEQNSYSLKHTVERELGEYVSNGQIILCCLLLGVKYNYVKYVTFSFDNINPNLTLFIEEKR